MAKQHDPLTDTYRVTRNNSIMIEHNALRRGSLEITVERSRLLHAEDFYNGPLIRYNGWKLLHAAVREGNGVEALRLLACLEPTEALMGHPGPAVLLDLRRFLEKQLFAEALPLVSRVLRRFSVRSDSSVDVQMDGGEAAFDVLFVQNKADVGDLHCDLALELSKIPKDGDSLRYASVTVTSFEDAMIAILYNHDIQAVVLTSDFVPKTEVSLFRHRFTIRDHPKKLMGMEEFIDEPLKRIQGGACIYDTLVDTAKRIRPELDLYFVGVSAFSQATLDTATKVRRVFAAMDDHTELHLAILEGIKERVSTPFFDAVVEYSQRPVGVFHALAISRGNSLLKSTWIQDLFEFYGRNIFKAESSSTCGGLDSLLDPHGTIKQAQEKAAKAFGAMHTFFVTNGTSTANKIVCQALMAPKDIVLIDRDCHKSHHYGMVLSGVQALYLDAYPLHQYSMYGGVPLSTLKRTLLQYRAAGKLHRVKMIILTNCTFDGVVYNVRRVMQELLAIKPDLIFLWDEAWFAYATFNPIMRRRTGMGAAAHIYKQLRNPEYRERYNQWRSKFGSVETASDEALMSERLLPDPDKAKVRVYVTQSTHKALTALRQGSMIHVYDELYRRQVAPAFHEAFFTHTSTSPNYQILASLDVGRSQMQLEGYQFVNDAIGLAMTLRKSLIDQPGVPDLMHFLDVDEMIPSEYRKSSQVRNGEHKFYTGGLFQRIETWWSSDDEFVLDPTRLTLYIGNTGLNGDTFKVEWLMDKYDIQVNKTSRNSVLFQTHIGTTHSSIGYLLQALLRISEELTEQRKRASAEQLRLMDMRVQSLTTNAPPLPDFSAFHPAFTEGEGAGAGNQDGDIRKAFFLTYNKENLTYVHSSEALERIRQGELLVATTFTIPYPPGFPILVPGQVITCEIIEFLIKLDVKEIHGYNSSLGLCVFKQEVLDGLIRAKGVTLAGNKRVHEVVEEVVPEEGKGARAGRKRGKATEEGTA
eukprot:comp22298_c0_seq1/m.33086 comp22298_c0_seq1/g.33086  ORF comp22298_c0_seq1/g.33086 comp22298_c0_seq1/m.33086 type:complete len:979 (-) comp22298_c0_seq1:738-3674(-)